MNNLIIIASFVFLLQGCSDEPDCIIDAQANSLIKQGNVGYADLRDHITCFDKQGRPIR